MCPSPTKNDQKQSCHQHISIEIDDPSTQVLPKKVKKKCRGPTVCASMISWKEKIELQSNERNKPIGPNSVKLVPLLDVLTREMVPITLSDWRKVSNQLKDDLWGIINASFRNLYICFQHFYFFMI